jgi:hypothetical protein
MVYDKNVMNEGNLRLWCRMVKDGQANMFTKKSDVVGQPSLVTDGLIQNVTHIFVKVSASQVENFCVNFHKSVALLCARLSELG